MLTLSEHEALLCLNTINGMGAQKLNQLFEQHPSYAEILASLPTQPSLKNILTELKEDNINYISFLDERYPSLLKEIASPPIVLYFQGNVELLNSLCIGVVGTRKISTYGEAVTNKIVPGLVEAGITIVSGFQRGIDTVAHQSALNSKGKTIAVLGTGLNLDYPPGNMRLKQAIREQGSLIISEFPPNTLPYKANFPRRNRIISGLSKGVIVVEAAKQSGSLITAKCAVEQDRDVFAIPGSIFSSLSDGPHHLIQQGAKLVSSADEIVEELGITVRTIKHSSSDSLNLPGLQQEIYTAIDAYGTHIDTIVKTLNHNAGEIMAELTIMELEGYIKHGDDGIYMRSGP